MSVNGFYFAGISSGIKEGSNKDLGLIYAPDGASVAAAFTENRFKAAHILIDAPKVKRRGFCRAVLVNSGNANACTGKKGLEDARRIIKSLARELEINERDVLIASTGIIGKRLPVKNIEKRLPVLVRSLSRLRAEHFAEAIMTTDRFIKIKEVEVKNPRVKVLGIAKGAGMIHPEMATATMLAFLLTDASATHLDLNAFTNEIVQRTFNRISVDGQTSTNDSFFMLASGKSGEKVSSGREARAFLDACLEVCGELAEAIVMDGEGATCVIEVEVKGAKSAEEADEVARCVANSMLVKTAFHGGEENWGRILQALGTVKKVRFNPSKVKLSINGRIYFSKGEPTGASIRQKKRKRHHVLIDLGSGQSSAKVLTSDLSEFYVKLNSEYTT